MQACDGCRHGAYDNNDPDQWAMVKALNLSYNGAFDEYTVTQMAEWAGAVDFATEILNHMDRAMLANLVRTKLRDAIIEAGQLIREERC
jgi:hypothetical protein